MTDTPLPTRGLLGAWFFDERFYDSGRDRVNGYAPTGYPANLKNGVTVGVEGDPAREFGASDFDASSSQYADVGEPLALANAKATVAIFKPENLNGTNQRIASNQNTNEGDSILIDDFDRILYAVKDGSGSTVATVFPSVNEDEYVCVVGAVKNGTNSLLVDGELRDTNTIGSFNAGSGNFNIGRSATLTNYFDGEIAAVARYDLTVPDAPEPSEIARKWDKLRDIPATR